MDEGPGASRRPTARDAAEAALEKEALRARFGAYRAGLSQAEYTERSRAIIARARALPELQQAATVHCYWPVLESREVDVRPLISWLQSEGKQIVLPVVVTFSREATAAPRLRHVRFTGPDALCPNRWGVYEPMAGISVSIEEIDVVIVPAFGAGRDGHRLGHGFGYYDEFLRDVHGPSIGLVYAACLVEAVPATAHDVSLSILVTESETVRTGPPP